MIPVPQSLPGADFTAAFNALVAQASVNGDRLQFPPGTFRFASRPDTIGAGIMAAVGDGSVGPSFKGTRFLKDYDEPDPEAGFITFDGD